MDNEKIRYITNIGVVTRGCRIVKLEGANESKHGNVITVNTTKQELEVIYEDGTEETASVFDFGLLLE